ncbi:MAG: hypothetical protein WDA27_08855 [Actinomycetota bacterium]
MRARSFRTGARTAVAIAAAVLALPSLAAATYTTCEPGNPDPARGCPKFDPQVEVGVQMPFVNAPSSLIFRFAQADLTMPAVDISYYVPKGWRFGVNQVRPAMRQDGITPATKCEQVYTGLGNHTDGVAARVGNAEYLSGGVVGMTAHIDMTRNEGPRNRRPPGTDLNWKPDPATFGYRTGKSSLVFLNWDAPTLTATLCMYVYSTDPRLDHSDDPNDLCNQRGVAPVGQADSQTKDQNCEAAREHLIPVTLTQIPAGEELSERFGWRVHFNLSSVYRQKYLFEQSATVLKQIFGLPSQSVGNWNTNKVTGEKQAVFFSRAPATPGSYEFRALLETCAQGFNPVGAAQMCKNNDERLSRIRSTFIDVTMPPTSVVHDFGRLTGPAGSTGMPLGFGLVRGAEEVSIPWTQPPSNPAAGVKGYVLVVAEPGDQDGRHIEYLVTDPADPEFDPSVCGEDGAGECSRTLHFPLSSVGGGVVLDGSAKYDVALVTVYKDRSRTDSRDGDPLCDDGTGLGRLCSELGLAKPRVVAPGVSRWEFLIAPEEWPNAFVEARDFVPSGGKGSFTAPAYMLLVDFSLRRAKFLIWNPWAPMAAFAAGSNGIVGSGDSGVVSFASSNVLGAPSFRFDGVAYPRGVGPPPPGVPSVNDPTAHYEANGVFVWLDSKGLPNTPNGMPTERVEPFEGKRL